MPSALPAAAPAIAKTPDASLPPPEFEEVYRRWFPAVARWCRALGGPEMEMEDLAQEVFLVVRRKLPGFDGENLPGWLYKIASYTVSDYRRRPFFRSLLLRPGDGHGAAAREIEAGDDPDAALRRREDCLLLYRLLDRLSEAQRNAFLLFEVEGFTGEEIAAFQGVPVATVWSRLHQARKELATRLARLRRAGRLP